MKKQIHIRFDWAMKKLLRHKANFNILEGFLSELFKEDVLIQSILESESNKDYPEDKFNRVDILVQNSVGELILVEIQNEREHDYFHRMLYGTSKLITQYLSAGDPYDQIKKVYSVNIVYFNLGQGEDYIYTGTTHFIGMHKKDVLGLSKSQIDKYQIQTPAQIFPTYYVLKLNAFDDLARDTLDEWIYFLKNSEIKDEFKAKGLPEAKERLRIDSLDHAERENYEAFVKFERIRQNEIESALFDEQQLRLEAQAKAEEAEAKIKETLQQNTQLILLLSQTMSAEQIASATAIPLSEILSILKRR